MNDQDISGNIPQHTYSQNRGSSSLSQEHQIFQESRLPINDNTDGHENSSPINPPYNNVTKPPLNTEKDRGLITGQVDHSIPPTDRSLTKLTSLEQVWNMPLVHNGRPTWKFLLVTAFLFYLILWSSVGLLIIKSFYKSDSVVNSGCKAVKNCDGMEMCLVNGCIECRSECLTSELKRRFLFRRNITR